MQYRKKKSHIILLEVGRRVMKENDDEIIFIKGRFCHIKHIFAKRECRPLFVCLHDLFMGYIIKGTYIHTCRKEALQL